EQRHDAVTHHLVHRALVLVHGVHHSMEDGVEERARLLGIAVGQELRGAFEVREQHRDLLALALNRAPRREDLLGEMSGDVGLGRARWPAWNAADRMCALETEFRRRGERRAAARTAPRQGWRAFQAELRLGRVLRPASRTDHAAARLPALERGHDLSREALELLQDDGLGCADGLADVDDLEAGVLVLEILELLGDLLRRADEPGARLDRVAQRR